MDILDRLDEMALAEDEIRRPWFSILTVISSISALAFLFKPEKATHRLRRFQQLYQISTAAARNVPDYGGRG